MCRTRSTRVRRHERDTDETRNDTGRRSNAPHGVPSTTSGSLRRIVSMASSAAGINKVSLSATPISTSRSSRTSTRRVLIWRHSGLLSRLPASISANSASVIAGLSLRRFSRPLTYSTRSTSLKRAGRAFRAWAARYTTPEDSSAGARGRSATSENSDVPTGIPPRARGREPSLACSNRSSGVVIAGRRLRTRLSQASTSGRFRRGSQTSSS